MGTFLLGMGMVRFQNQEPVVLTIGSRFWFQIIRNRFQKNYF
jgi:hypothetical protein